VLKGLRDAGLISYPSPLLPRFLEKLPEVFEVEVLPRLGPTYLALFGRVGGACRAAVVASAARGDERWVSTHGHQGCQLSPAAGLG